MQKIKEDEKKRGEHVMNIERALKLTEEEFFKLCEECKGFNDEFYKNHRSHNKGETFGEFIEKGSYRIKEDPIIKGKLI